MADVKIDHLHSSLWHSETEWDNAVYISSNSATNATISCKILVKIGPVVLAENMLIDIALLVHVVVWRISLNISGCNGPIIATFSPSESTLLADDGSVSHCPICQGTLPWQRNNVAMMKVN